MKYKASILPIVEQIIRFDLYIYIIFQNTAVYAIPITNYDTNTNKFPHKSNIRAINAHAVRFRHKTYYLTVKVFILK